MRRKMKKIMSAILLVVMLFITACSGSDVLNEETGEENRIIESTETEAAKEESEESSVRYQPEWTKDTVI